LAPADLLTFGRGDRRAGLERGGDRRGRAHTTGPARRCTTIPTATSSDWGVRLSTAPRSRRVLPSCSLRFDRKAGV
jgi:hypothetical protein